ncbi:hypothetical protein ACFOEQ_08330 [Chryseobacterium arachidis]|uniref:hypothetical protein n=1 Tax=Chryseobacterium arachidis TaxID=1416778 RepID=UPI00360DFAC0
MGKIGGVENKFTIIQNVDPNILGYSPTGIGANAPTTITVGSSTATKATCVKMGTECRRERTCILWV